MGDVNNVRHNAVAVYVCINTIGVALPPPFPPLPPSLSLPLSLPLPPPPQQVDDHLAELFLSEEPIEASELAAAIRRTTLANKFVPVFMGSAYKNKGGWVWLRVCAWSNGWVGGCSWVVMGGGKDGGGG